MKYLRILSPLLIVLMLLLAALPVSASTLYENYTTDDGNITAIYGDNWLARDFSAGTAHTVTSLELFLNRTGLPDIVTVSLRMTTASGHPTGSDFAAGTFNGSNITDAPAGEWCSVNLVPEFSLEVGRNYSIVVRAVAGDAGNCINWWWNSTDGSGYDYGYESSDDGGSSWTSEAYDLLFKVNGNSGMAISNASVFSSMVNDGDWLTVFLYQNIYAPYYQYESPEAYFNLQFYNDTEIVGQTKMPAWGYKPGSIYLSADVINSSDIDWYGAYDITMNGSADKFDSPTPSVTHTLVPSEYIGSEPFWLGEWIISTAHVIEGYYNVTLTMDTIGNDTLPYTILNELGGKIYMAGIPGIENLCPERFYVVYWQPRYTNGTFTNAYQNQLNWVNQTSTIGSAGEIPTILNDTGAQFNLSGSNIGMLVIFIAYIAVVGIALRIIGSVPWAVVVGTPILVAGGWLGLIPLAVILIMAAISLMAVIWIVYLRGT